MAYSVIGFVPGSRPGVLAQATSEAGRRLAADLVVEQAAERPEQELVDAEIGELEFFRQLDRPDRIGRGLDQDVQILLDARVGLGRKSTFEFGVHLSCRRELPLDKTRRQVHDLVVEALDAKLRCVLRL